MPDRKLLTNAQNLRKNQTQAESLLWSKLRSRQISGYKFRRQHPVDRYILDFYCYEANLAVELDGGQHLDDEVLFYDRERTSFLEGKGIRVIRFWNNDVLEHPDAVVMEIDAVLKEIMARKESGRIE